MERKRGILRSGAVTALLFLVAIALLLAGSIGGASAVFSTQSEDLTTEIQLKNIGLTIVENKNNVGVTEKLLTNLLGEGEKFEIGKEYQEELAVTNEGTIDEYVRVIVYRYWADAEGNKVQFWTDPENANNKKALVPEAIILTPYDAESVNKWIVDKNSSTRERVVLYYTEPLAPEITTDPFCDTIKIDSDIVNAQTIVNEVQIDETHKVITTDYIYDGYQFVIEVFADGVQTHNAERAILSAWGVHVNIDADGTLSLA